ncbi:MAG: putative Ig domain-containing protein [Acidobacteria bacterium]|nr:putative Ig domain-containing protein [Acidobacteriota bacterium]
MPVGWSLAPGSSLPAGLTLDTGSGHLSGTTTASGDFAFAVKARDSAGAVGSRRYVLTVFSVGGSAFPESRHPYAQGVEDVQSYTLEGNPPGILVTFDDRTELEAGFDFLHVTDAGGSAVRGSPFSGRELAGQTLRVPGATVRLRLAADASLGGIAWCGSSQCRRPRSRWPG